MQSLIQTQIDILVKLQAIEIESNYIRSMLGDVSQKLELLDAKRMAFEQQLTEKQDQLEELKKKYRSHESDTDVNMVRIKKSHEKLRAVKTNKEYQSILKEIEDIETINSTIEDEMLDYLDQMEATEGYLSSKRGEFREFEDQINREKASIREESEVGKKRFDELQTEWDKISQQVEPDLLKTYMTIKDKRGTAVAAVNDSVCRECHLNIPPQLYNELQRCDRLRFCPNCQRIIYWKAS